MNDNAIRTTAGIAAENSGTDWLQLRGARNFFDISVSGTFAATVHLQRKRPGEDASAARDVESYTAGTEKLGEMQGHWDVRLFVKSGNYTSGTVKAELGS
jgi:hypothetical protein